MISIGRGFRQQNSILWPMNKGMSMVAKNRIQQAVGMQNERHIESLKTDGVELQIWIKQFSGQLCSCSMTNSEDNYKLPQINNNGGIDSNPLLDIDVDDLQNNITYDDFQLDNDYNKNYKNVDLTEDLIEQYAEDQDNSLVFGGDKTPCGICLGTGYKNGYSLFNGKRIVLDYFDNPEYFGFSLERTYPYSYIADYSSDNYIIWKFQAPTYFKDFLGVRIRNNVEQCKNYKLYISFDGNTYNDYSDNLIKARNKTPTYIWLKVVPNSLLDLKEKFSITHIEVYYQLGLFPFGDFAPITKAENWELFEALQTTSLELAGDAVYIDRESVITDKKNNTLWKVTSVTPHMIADKQIFKNELELRMIQQNENLYLLNLINSSNIILNYRGLEQKQDMLTYNGEYKQ